jgi:putative ABC transport system ATP-binding protein
MIALENISKIYDDKLILKDISLKIDANECVLLDGVSGSGKTTLLSIIAGVLSPSSGRVLYNGENIISYSDYFISDYRKNIISYIPQHFYFFEHLTLAENISLVLHAKELPYKEIEKKVIQVLKRYKIYSLKDQMISSLSGGQRQRAVIARAMASDALVYLFDEPTAHLDQQNKEIIYSLLEELKSNSKTIILASHEKELKSLKIIDKIYKLDKGLLVE